MHKIMRSPVGLMALTIFIDFVGFGLILPLLPFWSERLGAGPVGTVAGALPLFSFMRGVPVFVEFVSVIGFGSFPYRVLKNSYARKTCDSFHLFDGSFFCNRPFADLTHES